MSEIRTPWSHPASENLFESRLCLLYYGAGSQPFLEVDRLPVRCLIGMDIKEHGDRPTFVLHLLASVHDLSWKLSHLCTV